MQFQNICSVRSYLLSPWKTSFSFIHLFQLFCQDIKRFKVYFFTHKKWDKALIKLFDILKIIQEKRRVVGCYILLEKKNLKKESLWTICMFFVFLLNRFYSNCTVIQQKQKLKRKKIISWKWKYLKLFEILLKTPHIIFTYLKSIFSNSSRVVLWDL